VILLITFFASVLILRWFRGERYSFAFRDKLLVALIVTALVPLACITLYGRYYARERLMDNTAKRLKEETSSVVLNVAEPQQGRQNEVDFPITQSTAEQIAADLGTDFNLYVDGELKVSSQPELYEAGILDRRMSGSAYEHIVLGGKRFHLQTESIGAYQYAVGYRPVQDNAGAIIGVVSVPTVYRQDELEEENSRRNAFLFGIFILVLLSILIIATTFANRIAAPIHRLTEATKKVSQGDLDVNLRVPTADGEIGELVRSFGAMTRDLKRNREHLVRYERELAWKEMARQVAHEIKNPLTPMKLSLQHLRQTYKDKVPHFGRVLDDVSKTIIEQIETLSHIASEFSHFGRMPRAHLETCNVNAILSESVHLFDQGANVEFTLNLDPNLRPLMADHEELRRAFINVIRNGIQAMENRGRMVITSRGDAGRIVITIRDSGAGIPEEIKEKLFQPNFSTKTDGMGLGLAIVKKTVDDLKGSIAVESDSGEGTTVTITLPLSMTPVESTTGKS
jgi:signal transduction histidine kinase